MPYNVLVDKAKCVGCGECVDVCPLSVYDLLDKKAAPLRPEDCVGCEACVEVCQVAAIVIEEV